MKLTQTTIAKIKDPGVRRELTNVFGCTDQTIVRYINKNKVHGPLTTIGAINKIKECTDLKESEILTEEKLTAKFHQ